MLYLALEDTARRLQSRMGKLLGSDNPPPGLDIATEWPTLPAGGSANYQFQSSTYNATATLTATWRSAWM